MIKKLDKVNTGLSALFTLCATTTDDKLRASLLDLFLSSQEKRTLSDRYWVLKALVQSEQTQRVMAKELQVSIAKITRGSNELKRIDKKLLTLLKEKL